MHSLRILLSGRSAAAATAVGASTAAAAAGGCWWYSSARHHSSEDPQQSANQDLGFELKRRQHVVPVSSTSTESKSDMLCCEPKATAAPSSSKLIFLGTGSSTGCPRPLCPLLFAPSKDDDGSDAPPVDEELAHLRQTLAPYCRTSNLAVDGGDPTNNKNYRNNPSFLLHLSLPTTVTKNVIIDVGKTFREGALRWLPRHQIRSIDAIVLTHQHMDAAGGLDDVRGFQKYVPRQQQQQQQLDQKNSKEKKASLHVDFRQVPMPLFLSEECLLCLQDQFPWLLPKPAAAAAPTTKDGKPFVSRHVASFDVTVFDAFQPIYPVPGLKITPLPVMHGEDLVSFGFAFTIPTAGGDGGSGFNVVYLSDISRMLPETLEYITTKLPQPTHLLVLDALLIDKPNPVHFNLQQAMELVEQIRPEQTYLVGMNCDSFLPHEAMNERLRREYGGARHNVQLAHDGLVIEVPQQHS